MSTLTVAALVVAAGRGARMGTTLPKQFLDLGGRMVLSRAIEAFLRHPMIGRLLVVMHPADEALVTTAIADAPNPNPATVTTAIGGTSRQQSVHKGLWALEQAGFPKDGLVLVHDAARPFIDEALITRAIAAGLEYGAAIPVLPVTDTLAEVGPSGRIVVGQPDRSRLRAVQTPQAFRFQRLMQAHAIADIEGLGDAYTDDAGVVRAQGHPVGSFAGSDRAFKLTTPEDVARAERMLAPARTDIRSATGYDVHAFGPGDHVTIGGVSIPHDRGVVGHSDADVLLHALTDALLGCIADGDIGVHFPPSDMRWKGMASRVFLAEAVRRVHALGGEIRHLDGTIVSEAPRIGPYRDAIRATIAEIAGISPSRVGLKATTSEKMGFTGRREGLAALATATIALPGGE